MAKTFIADSNTSAENLRDAVANTNYDTIIISGNITLEATEYTTAVGPINCGLYVPFARTLKLHINSGCKLTVCQPTVALKITLHNIHKKNFYVIDKTRSV